MPERTIDFGKFGARGIKGSDAVARKLDELSGGIVTPVTVKRGLMARLHYLMRTDHSRRAARDAGLTVTDRTLKAWLDERRRPTSANLERIDAAYRQVRRQNVARHLLRRLNARGGTRVEIHPLNQSQVPRPLQRMVEYRTMNVRRWDRIVEAWASGDHQGLDDAWEDTIVDLGSQWGQYEYVTNIGFAA
ncbi:transcriptional regulator (plasmid) [Streptomyces sp. NBC_00053]|uniref:transcriptional regulator n=1 Tax=unclassified Streptomyces TaxID=2593676 RepID=UPI002255CBA1|nr:MULTISPECIES: transcriptional regulator [unclassified Streptomyces]MCX4399524.1 transcriptional regulator [Streptomyces sp. NBC_01767]MCX4400073.1 transcriptional regulator [Streptomyces sp. NBC_01767]MCX5106774.1 transcriptional regulator [Streptomyces sp. NBC_00439]MCX5506132.1 transcriptional regulator [Streptomyces sp. NBC_00052]MCX5554165.1 transcriptional regulator [Streptomyces sp. NBC_00051]